MAREESTRDLSRGAEEVLPEHAKEIYKEAHNSALEEYKDQKKRRGRRVDNGGPTHESRRVRCAAAYFRPPPSPSSMESELPVR